MKDSEAKVQADIQIDAFSLGCSLMRNNSGVLKDETGRPVRFGLGNVSKQQNEQIKSSDLIGFTRVTITPEMVGRTVAIFTAAEIKAPDWKRSQRNARENAQENFCAWIRNNGGFAGIVNSVEAFRKILGR